MMDKLKVMWAELPHKKKIMVGVVVAVIVLGVLSNVSG